MRLELQRCDDVVAEKFQNVGHVACRMYGIRMSHDER